MPGFFILTFGCRSNQADSAAIRESLLRHGAMECGTFIEADLIVVNTCTVTHRSDQQVRQAIRRMHRENSAARIVVTGCYAQRDAAALAKLQGVSLIVGNAEKSRIAELLQTAELTQRSFSEEIFCSPQIAISKSESQRGSSRKVSISSMAYTGGKTRPLVKLQEGCDNRCAYCIVPSVRGPARSASPEDVLSEIQSLISRGFQEIVLTGINLGAYGRRSKGHMRLPELLQQIIALPNLGRIRLSSIEPVFFDAGIVRLAVANPTIARHFHIPLQSGSDRILRAMHRPYTSARFRELMEFIHRELPDAGLGTDVIIGFPGETELDFAATLRFLQELPLSYIHVFPFSPREGTEAFSLSEQIPHHVTKERMAQILALARAMNLEFRRRFLGQMLPAITLTQEEAQGEAIVLTHNYIHARVPELSIPPNRLIHIRIEEVLADSTRATVSTPSPHSCL